MTDAQRKDAILLITGPGSCYVGKSQVAYELARALRTLSKSIGQLSDVDRWAKRILYAFRAQQRASFLIYRSGGDAVTRGQA